MEKIAWLVLGGVTFVAALRAGSSLCAMYVGRAALGVLFIVFGALVNAIYLHLEAKRNSEHRAEETQMTEEARGIASIDPDDPRFKIID